MADLAAEIAKLTKTLEQLASRDETIEKQLAKQISALDALPEPRMKLTGLVKSYMAAVKKTDGLTSARPATVKAVQAAEKDPSKDGAIAAAIKELRMHVAALKDGKDKKAKQFAASIESIISQIKSLA